MHFTSPNVIAQDAFYQEQFVHTKCSFRRHLCSFHLLTNLFGNVWACSPGSTHVSNSLQFLNILRFLFLGEILNFQAKSLLMSYHISTMQLGKSRVFGFQPQTLSPLLICAFSALICIYSVSHSSFAMCAYVCLLSLDC